MTAEFVAHAPRDLRVFDEAEKIEVDNMDINLSKQAVNEVAEIFHTPLTGSFNWDYQLGASLTGTSDVYTIGVRVFTGTGDIIGSLTFYDLTE